MRRWRLLPLLLFLAWCRPAQAQFGPLPVIDVANLTENTVTAIQTAITAIQTVYIVANQVLELTPLDEIVVAEHFINEMWTIGAIAETAQELSYDITELNAQITALFDLQTAPRTRVELDTRLAEIKRVLWEACTFAVRTQLLLVTIYRTIDDVTRLVGLIGGLLGNMQANQTLVQMTATVSKTLAVLETQTSAYYRVGTLEKLSEALITESLTLLDQERRADWPRP